MCKISLPPPPLPDFWDLIIDAAQQDWNELVEIGVSVSQVQEPIANNSSDGFSHLSQKWEGYRKS